MDRRLLLTSIAAAAAASACTRRNDDQATADRTGRPTLAIESEGPGRWRIRSWQWRANAWRPRIAQARMAGGKIEISGAIDRSEEHTSELQSLMRISYAVFCLKKKKKKHTTKIMSKIYKISIH